MSRADLLATVGGFVPAAPHLPHGTAHASWALTAAIARSGRFARIDAHHEGAARVLIPPFPGRTRVVAVESSTLARTSVGYHAVYVTEGVVHQAVGLRPAHDSAPVLVDLGSTHAPMQWLQLLSALAAGLFRASDVLIAKSNPQARVLEAQLALFAERLAVAVGPHVVVVPNGVDVQGIARDEALRVAGRRELGVGDDDVVFLAFSRLSPHTKGDQRGLVVAFAEVLARAPHALLVLAGGVTEPSFVDELRAVARTAGVANRVAIVGNPFEQHPRARDKWMSTADVFVHPSTGAEEAMSLVVLEAMSSELPVVVADWSGARDVITDGAEGFLIPTFAAPLPPDVGATVFSHDSASHNGRISQSAAWDGSLAIARMIALATHASERETLGRTARRTVVERFAIDEVVRQRLALFDDAAAASTAPAPVTPLIDLDGMLRALATTALRPTDRVRAVGNAAAESAAVAVDPRFAAVLEAIEEEGELAIDELRSLSGHTEMSMESFSQLLLRMADRGLVTFERS